jgi:putative ABC transport system ATP-binding protein
VPSDTFVGRQVISRPREFSRSVGKSTLLLCLAGMDDPDGGIVRIAGQRMSHRTERDRARIRARHVGMLFQSVNLAEHLSVAQNLALVQ